MSQHLSAKAVIASYQRRDAVVARLLEAVRLGGSLDKPTPNEMRAALKRFRIILDEAIEAG